MIKIGDTLEEFKKGFASGEYKLREDEYLDADGLPYCKKCKTKRFYCSKDKQWCIRSMCKCQEAARKKQEEEEAARKRMEEFNNRKALSLTGKRYRNLMFKDATITEHNSKAYQKASAYVEKSKEVFAENIGLYIYGDNSSGKTFLIACICNELVWKGYRCIYTNLATILNEIRGSYDRNGMGECTILRNLEYYDFAFIDDLGKEFLGREYNESQHKISLPRDRQRRLLFRSHR